MVIKIIDSGAVVYSSSGSSLSNTNVTVFERSAVFETRASTTSCQGAPIFV
jgi:hypothetical protein